MSRFAAGVTAGAGTTTLPSCALVVARAHLFGSVSCDL